MAPATKVQLRLGDRIVAEVPFRGDELRIGRMKENDLVINNLAVSRFHAVLRRVEDGFEVQDLGSENGTLLDGARVEGSAPLRLGAELTVGKHTLVLRSGDQAAAAAPQAQKSGKSDAWDAAQTYFAPELAARALPREAPAAPPAAERAPEEEDVVMAAVEEAGPEPLEASAPAPLEAAAHHLPDPDGLFAFGEEELARAAPAPSAGAPGAAAAFDVAASEVAPAGPEAAPEPMAASAPPGLFDFGATDDLGLSDPSLGRAAAAAPEPGAAPAPGAARHAGVIVERAGRVEQVQPFEGEELVVGRGPSCDLVLAGAGVSRRHARLVREGERFRVLDLGSANGVSVNGERVRDQELRVGDVVAIDDYTLTFVIDREPIDRVVQSRRQRAHAPSKQVTVLHDAPLAQLVEQDLVLAAEDDEAVPIDAEKELEMVEQGSLALAAAFGVEIEIAAEQLPAPLREALAALGTSELRIPVELKIRPKR